MIPDVGRSADEADLKTGVPTKIRGSFTNRTNPPVYLVLGRLQCYGIALTACRYRSLVMIGEVNTFCGGPHTLRDPRLLQLSLPQSRRHIHHQSNIEWLSVSKKRSRAPSPITLLLPRHGPKLNLTCYCYFSAEPTKHRSAALWTGNNALSDF